MPKYRVNYDITTPLRVAYGRVEVIDAATKDEAIQQCGDLLAADKRERDATMRPAGLRINSVTEIPE